MPDQDEGYQLIGTQDHDGESLELAVEEPAHPAEPTPEPETPPEPEPETPEQVEEKKKLTGSARAKAKAERLAEDLRQANERIAALERGSQPEKPKAQEPAGKPKLDDFETFDAYNDALVDWKVKTELQRKEVETETQRQRRELDDKVEKAKSKYDDFVEVMQELPVFPPAMASVIAASEYTADLIYHLGTNPDEQKRIINLAPGKQALEIAKLERQFETVPEPPKKQETKAPPPMRPTHGGVAAPQEDAGYTIY